MCGQKGGSRPESKIFDSGKWTQGVLVLRALVWITGSQGDSGKEGTSAGFVCSPASHSEQEQPIFHLPLPLPSSAPSQLNLGTVLQQVQPGLCSGVAQLGLLLPFLGSEEQCWAGEHNMVGEGSPATASGAGHENDLKPLCSSQQS